MLKIYDTYAKFYNLKSDYISANEHLQKRIDLTEELHREDSKKKLAELEAKYETQIFKLQKTELDKSNDVMKNQIATLNKSLYNLETTHQKLKAEFQQAVTKMNTQDDLLSSQARMAVMGEMVSSIAHQWRQPLNVIGILAQSIGDAWDYNELDDEFLEKQIEHITGQISYMNETINDFRNFFKPDYIVEFGLNTIIEKSINLVTPLIKKSNITLTTELEKTCKHSGNPNELIQVFINIINNAREAMVRNNIDNPEIKIRLNCKNNQTVVSLFNSGKPINQEHLSNLFEPYFTTRGNEGTGIGLYICRLIIENKFSGTIEAINHENGVEFIIKLPQNQ